MSFGKLYTFKGNTRSIAIRAVAKANKLDLEYVNFPKGEPRPADYVKLNPLNRVPTFEGADGYVLSESIAVAVYITSQNEKTTLLGKTKQDYASILRWMSFTNQELLPHVSLFFTTIQGTTKPYNKRTVDEHYEKAMASLNVLDKHLLINTFLVGERLTLADLYCAGLCTRAFEYVLGKKQRAELVNLTRWFEAVYNQPIYHAIAEPITFCDETLKNAPPASDAPPKKEKAAAPKKETAAAKPKAAAADEEEDEAPAAPKAKHPLEALEKPEVALDEWKRQYSNEETRTVALPWFWENFKAKDYSLWKVDYKYNEELTLTFMTSNLIGGFFNRLEASRKYLFGSCSVYGVSNDSVVQGAFLVRGQEALPAFDVAPDYESYSFTKLDPSSPADRAFVEDQWSWDKPITVNGKTYQWADGKVFK